MHTALAGYYGATEEELRETYFLASLTSRWSAMIHAQNYPLETFQQEAQQMGGYLQQHATEEARMVNPWRFYNRQPD
jgi:hypothetical protein